MNYHRSSKW